MTQDIKHLPPLGSSHKNSASTEEADSSTLCTTPNPEDTETLNEQLRAAQGSIQFLQKEQAVMLQGLHQEIERLQSLCRDLQFRYEVGGLLLPQKDPAHYEHLEQQVVNLEKENKELQRRLLESQQALDILDQKEKLALWQHHRELQQKEETIQLLQQELQTKSEMLRQAQVQGASGSSRRKKGVGFWRRLGFASSGSNSLPLHSKIPLQPRVDHLSKEDLPSEIQSSLESQYQSYSSYSSSERSLSDSEEDPNRLPPIDQIRHRLVRQQLRLEPPATSSLAIDRSPMKRLSKA